MARAAQVTTGWKRAGVWQEVWKKRPHYAFRNGFFSELKRLGADADAVEHLPGHSLGLRGAYLDSSVFPCRRRCPHSGLRLGELRPRPSTGAQVRRHPPPRPRAAQGDHPRR